MFLPVVVAAAAIVGLLVAPLWRAATRGPIALMLALPLCVAALSVRNGYSLYPAEPLVAALATEAPWRTDVDPTTASAMTMVPAVRALPVDDPSRDRRVSLSFQGCAGPAGWRLLHRVPVPIEDPAAIQMLRRHGLFFAARRPTSLCVFAKPPQERAAARQPALAGGV